MRKLDAFDIRVCEQEFIRGTSFGSQSFLRDLKNASGRLQSYLPGIILHRSLRLPPRIWASRDHMDLAHDLSVGRVHCFAVHIFAVTRELSSADEILYHMLQIKAHRIRVTGSVMEQAKLVLMLLRDLHFIGNGGRKSTSLRELTKTSSIEAVSSWYVTYRCLGARAASFPGCASRCFLSSRG